ncbi:hypothetical protein [Thalassomonas actiniarum]|uniref:Flagellar protein FliT n=1 Tax=Thalassomonas actiniarum TaxID=485447 RepID=A0AAE9YTH4_9GAMM|nr:hypothetical protein [Thalassomonas actiniarum]WDE00483.1 hypothetical protein SG35_007555 [Thalassomonas actiniarum]
MTLEPLTNQEQKAEPASSLKDELLALIALSEEMLAIVQEEEIDVILLAQKEAQRFAGVQHFFQAYDKSAYQVENPLLNTLQQLDHQILARCNEYKQAVADQLVGFKKNQKAVNAYKGK